MEPLSLSIISYNVILKHYKSSRNGQRTCEDVLRKLPLEGAYRQCVIAIAGSVLQGRRTHRQEMVSGLFSPHGGRTLPWINDTSPGP